MTTRRDIRACTAALAACACFSRSALVAQTFSIDPPPVREGSTHAKGPVLCVRRVELAPQYEGSALVYRTGPHRLERDPYARFAAAPADMLTAAVREHLRRADFAPEVVGPGAALSADLQVDVYASDLFGDLEPASEAAAVVSLRFLVFSVQNGRRTQPILSEEFSRRTRLPRRTAAAVVGGLNQGLSDIMAEFVAELTMALRTSRMWSPGPPG
ncbi:MAG TPA: ABC-type transport auxiliary lipoprotein family protein [Anaeromyxobacteraceae bacterium]|nr:ABC-type transport auxiliary lipoprotein family protein [Anaeromyxobacteraceae bacterium]